MYVHTSLVERNTVSTMTEPALDFGKPLDEMSKTELFEAGLEVKDVQLKSAPKAKPVKTVETKDTALAAVKEEAEEVPTRTFTYDGDEYTVPEADSWDLDIFEAVEDGQIVTAVRGILGQKQYYDKFKAKKRKAKDLADIFSIIQENMGTKEGE